MSGHELYRTTDEGFSWKIDSVGYFNRRTIQHYDIQTKNNGEGWLNCSTGIYYTSDFGNSWDTLSKTFIGTKIYFTGKNTGWCIYEWGKIDKYIGDTLTSSVVEMLFTPTTLVQVFPNPTTNTLHIKLHNEVCKPIVMYCVDMLGNSVASQESFSRINNREYLLDTSTLPDGVYSIVLQTEAICITKNFVVVR